ncbi:flavodoxin [Blautia marasmi]|uniref:flavodoxin n=1 Tax=Blautia marasmi TaxID=1917868 RepID=UPI003AB94C8C
MRLKNSRVEAYDLNGKTLIPFATSGGSGLGDSGRNMAALTPGAKVADGRRFTASVNGKELSEWAAQKMQV